MNTTEQRVTLATTSVMGAAALVCCTSAVVQALRPKKREARPVAGPTRG